jgi:hypothetical protein
MPCGRSIQNCLTVTLLFCALQPVALAETMDGLLARGPVVLVENDGKGRFTAATGVISVDAPIERVWKVVTAFEQYKEFVPKVISCRMVSGQHTSEPVLRWEMDTPIINTVYSARYHVDDSLHTLVGDQVEGALKGSHFEVRLDSAGQNRTLVYSKSQARNFSFFLDHLDDSLQSITIGINVGGTVAWLKAIKRRSEELSR